MTNRTQIIFTPVKIERKKNRFDLCRTIIKSIEKEGESLIDGDILAISSKFISMSKGRMIRLDKVQPSSEAKSLAMKLSMDPRISQLVIQEADTILGGVPGFVLTLKDGVIAPNAGIDKSNAPVGYVMLYSTNPFKDAEDIKNYILSNLGKHVGVVVTDSRLMPLRLGTTGLAVSVAGFEPIMDERGRKDLFNNVLRVTRRALADQIAAASQLLMGEADEGFPVVIVRALDELPWKLSNKLFSPEDLTVESEKCIYMRGISRDKFSFC